MTFAAFKILWALARPGSLTALALALGVALWLFAGGRWRRAGRALVVLATLFLLALLTLPVGSLVTWPLEARVPPAALPDRVAGIVILGGAVHAPLTERHGPPAVNEAADRILSGLTLARRYPEARVIFSGGSALPFADGMGEAAVARRIFAGLGFSGPRFIFESESRNTRENAVRSKALADPRSGEAWVLVTSAAHMPRALGVFEAAGWPVLAHPVDYRTHGHADPVVDMNLGEELRLLEYGLHEWLGLAAYRLRGWTTTFWPEGGER